MQSATALYCSSSQLTFGKAQSPAEAPSLLVIISPLLLLLLLLLVHQQSRFISAAPAAPAALLGLSAGWFGWPCALAAASSSRCCSSAAAGGRASASLWLSARHCYSVKYIWVARNAQLQEAGSVCER
jgi:hypothetical protein